MTIQIFSTTK